MRRFCFLRNVMDVQGYGSTPYYRRFGQQFLGHKVPFVAYIAYMIFDRQTKVLRDHPLAPKCHKGIFIGYESDPVAAGLAFDSL